MNKEDIINAINTIKTYLGMEVKLAQMKLAQMKLADGVTILEFDSLEVGKEVFIVSENGNVSLPMGEYELEDGNILEVYKDGIIGEVKSKEEEAEPLEEEEPAMPVEASVEQPQQAVKKVIKSTIEEQHFAEIEKLKAEIVELKSMIEQKEEVKEEVIELAQEEEVKPISFNPENVNEIKAVKLNSNKSISMRDRILQTVYNK